jgi:hypothetical protein
LIKESPNFSDSLTNVLMNLLSSKNDLFIQNYCFKLLLIQNDSKIEFDSFLIDSILYNSMKENYQIISNELKKKDENFLYFILPSLLERLESDQHETSIFYVLEILREIVFHSSNEFKRIVFHAKSIKNSNSFFEISSNLSCEISKVFHLLMEIETVLNDLKTSKEGTEYGVDSSLYFIPKIENVEYLIFCQNLICRKKLHQIFRCSKCQLTYYCSKECQLLDWKIHKFDCK